MKMWAQLFLLEGPVATQLAAIRLPEIKIYPGQPDLDTHAHVRVHMCCTADSHSREHDCSSCPNKETVTREAALLLSSTLGRMECLCCISERLCYLFSFDTAARSGAGAIPPTAGGAAGAVTAA